MKLVPNDHDLNPCDLRIRNEFLGMTDESMSFTSHNEPAHSVLGVPALVVSGFLGAGKTTLVKHLIEDAQRQGLKLAVVSNEFGELGIDRALLQEAGGPGYVELEGWRSGLCRVRRWLCLLSINQ
jgi:hypothetical protein